MATRTKKTPVSKSAAAREMFRAGKTVTETAEALSMNYAFAYGVAKRAGLVEDAAKRRSTKAVAVVNNIAVIRPISGGVIRVDLSTGKIKRTAK